MSQRRPRPGRLLFWLQVPPPPLSSAHKAPSLAAPCLARTGAQVPLPRPSRDGRGCGVRWRFVSFDKIRAQMRIICPVCEIITPYKEKVCSQCGRKLELQNFTFDARAAVHVVGDGIKNTDPQTRKTAGKVALWVFGVFAGLWMLVNHPFITIFGVFVALAVVGAKAQRCYICGNLLKRSVYVWNLDGSRRRVCPHCNRTLETRNSRDAMKQR